jgi:hypothetical protein
MSSYSETVEGYVAMDPDEFLRSVTMLGARGGWLVSSVLPNQVQMTKRALSTSSWLVGAAIALWPLGLLLRRIFPDNRTVTITYRAADAGTSFSAFVDKDFKMAQDLKALAKGS